MEACSGPKYIPRWPRWEIGHHHLVWHLQRFYFSDANLSRDAALREAGFCPPSARRVHVQFLHFFDCLTSKDVSGTPDFETPVIHVPKHGHATTEGLVCSSFWVVHYNPSLNAMTKPRGTT